MTVSLRAEHVARLVDSRIFSLSKGLGSRWVVGDTLTFDPDTVIEPFVGVHRGAVLCTMGSFSFSNSVLPRGMLIGRYSSIGPDLRSPSPRHPIEFISTSNFTYPTESALIREFIRQECPTYASFRQVTQPSAAQIGNDVWIGSCVTLLPGVQIGDGAVVGAGAVVSRDVKPYEVVAGNPAKIIRMRFDDDVVEEMIDLQWWRYRFTDFGHLPIDKPREFLAQFREVSSSLAAYRPKCFRPTAELVCADDS